MGKTYNIVFNSAIAGGIPSNDNQFFFYDWSCIPEGRYKCSFTFVNGSNQRVQLFFAGMIFMDLGQTNMDFADRSSALSGASIPFGAEYYNTGFIGCFNILNTRNNAGGEGNGAYIVNTVDNPPFYLDKRPPNNRINIRIVDNIATTPSNSQGTLFTYNMGNYILTLHLEHLE